MEKQMFRPAMIEKLNEYDIYINRFINERCVPIDEQAIWQYIYENPEIGIAVAENYRLTNEERIDELVNELTKHKLSALAGVKGSGKTAFMFFCAEEIYERIGIPTTIFRPLYVNTDLLPKYFSIAMTEPQIKRNTFTIYDEAQISLSSRRGMAEDHIKFSDFLTIQRQRDVSAIISQQVLAMVDVNVFRMADHFIFKRFSGVQMATEEQRKNPFNLFLNFIRPLNNKDVLFISDDFSKIIFLQTDLPSFWCDELSKPMAEINEEEARRIVIQEFYKGRPVKEIAKLIWLKGVDWDTSDIMRVIEDSDQKIRKEDIKHLPQYKGICPRCKSDRVVKWGFKNGKQDYKCNECGHRFTLE